MFWSKIIIVWIKWICTWNHCSTFPFSQSLKVFSPSAAAAWRSSTSRPRSLRLSMLHFGRFIHVETRLNPANSNAQKSSQGWTLCFNSPSHCVSTRAGCCAVKHTVKHGGFPISCAVWVTFRWIKTQLLILLEISKYAAEFLFSFRTLSIWLDNLKNSEVTKQRPSVALSCYCTM